MKTSLVSVIVTTLHRIKYSIAYFVNFEKKKKKDNQKTIKN